MEITNIEGSEKTTLFSPWQHGEKFSLLTAPRGAVKNGISFGYRQFEGSSRKNPVIVLKDTRGGCEIILFVSMMLKKHLDQQGNEVQNDPQKGSFNLSVEELYKRSSTDEEMLKAICDLVKGHKLLCDRSVKYKDADGKTQRLVQFSVVD